MIKEVNMEIFETKHDEVPNYPLISNKRWYAENGTVYNSGDDGVKIALIFDDGSYGSLPNDIATMIALALNGESKP